MTKSKTSETQSNAGSSDDGSTTDDTQAGTGSSQESDQEPEPQSDLPKVLSEHPSDDELDKYSSHLARDTTALENRVEPDTGRHRVIDARSSQDRVMIVQAALHAAGYQCQVDGAYGRQTTKAVERFQADNDIGVTGVVRAATLRKLISKLLR